jgi:hypothetical protein
MKSLGLESVSRLIIWRLPALVPAGARAGVRPFVRCNSCTLTNISRWYTIVYYDLFVIVSPSDASVKLFARNSAYGHLTSDVICTGSHGRADER